MSFDVRVAYPGVLHPFPAGYRGGRRALYMIQTKASHPEYEAESSHLAGQAIFWNDAAEVKFFADRTDPKKKQDGKTLLHRAVNFADSAIAPASVKYFLDIGVDPLAKNDDGLTPAEYAMSKLNGKDTEEWRIAVKKIASVLKEAETSYAGYNPPADISVVPFPGSRREQSAVLQQPKVTKSTGLRGLLTRAFRPSDRRP